MTEQGKTPEKERAMLALSCPACSAPVNIVTCYKMAKCRACGLEWRWRSIGLRVALSQEAGC